VIQIEHRGLDVSFTEFIGFGIYFCVKKSVDRVYRSYGPAVSGSTVDRPWEGGRSSSALSAPVLRGAGACCESLGRERVTLRSSLRVSSTGSTARKSWRLRTKVMTASLRGQLDRSMKKRGGAGQRNVVENGEVEVPFLGLERRGGSRWEELDGGRGVRFEVGRFEDEGDTVRRRFIRQKEGGRAALRFGSPCMEEGAASGGARCGNADRASGGGLGVRGKEMTPEVGQAGPKAKTGRKA
jgi:hypothetical protein